MAVKALIKRNTYYDSVTLMTASSAISQLPGVEVADRHEQELVRREPQLPPDRGRITPAVRNAVENHLHGTRREAQRRIELPPSVRRNGDRRCALPDRPPERDPAPQRGRHRLIAVHGRHMRTTS